MSGARATAAGARREAMRNVALVLACQVANGLTYSAIPLLLPLIREDLAMSFSEAGMLSAAATFSYALGQVPAGYLCDRLGPKRLFFIGLLGWSALSVNFGLLGSFSAALWNQLAAGAFRALLFAPGLVLLASWFPPERRATAMSLYMVGGFSGNIVVALAGPALAARAGWRVGFILFAALGVAAALCYGAWGSERPRQRAGAPAGLGEAIALLRHAILWVCAGLQFVRFSVVTAFNFWLPTLLVADRGLSLEAAGLITALAAACTAFSNALGGYASDRLANPPLVIGASLAVLGAACAALPAVQSLPALLAVVALSAVFLQFYFGPLFLVPVEVLGARTAGIATGFTNLFANVGGLLTAYALGAVRDAAGSFAWGFYGVAALCGGGVALAALLAALRRRALAARARGAPEGR